ncbi:hypothetical protein GX50_03030 [[Emmonsia] crescens]|uniref:Calcineurin-like phosphoesterase domain-containing protein n=1 Tax=[Emmonsia] crescens TaxID=73230 RepID=A0A2B7ZLC9_9EURO|nr:hypothetical protein GX50_03030 [Emmonsia crescens]
MPANTDILITHVPTKGHLDLDSSDGEFLMNKLWRLQRKPILHGHIHAAYDVEQVRLDRALRAFDDMAICNEKLMQLLCLFHVCLCWMVVPKRTARSTWLVNAAIVGGFRDDERSKPISMAI